MKIDIEKIKEIYGTNYIYQIRDNLDIVVDNLNYLVNCKFLNVYEILESYPYLFFYSKEEFKSKVDNLINNLGVEYIEKLDENMSLWGDLL